MEKALLNKIQLNVSKMKCRLFRNNVGLGWVGKLVSRRNTPNGLKVTLASARPLHSGLVIGSSDLIGWTTVVVTPEMVGGEVAIFTAIEVKTGKTGMSKEQSNFIQRVRESGGIAGEARDLEAAVQIINNGTKQL